jgi:hypothetical protein
MSRSELAGLFSARSMTGYSALVTACRDTPPMIDD